MLRVLVDDVLEELTGLVEVVVLVVDARLAVLDHHQLGRVGHVLNVRVERGDHLLLVFRDRQRIELVLVLELAARFLHLLALLVVVDVQGVLPRQDRGVGGVLDVLALGVQLDDLRVLLGRIPPLLQRPQELAVVEGHVVDVLVVREVVQELLVDELGQGIRVLVLRLLGFLVPDEGQLLRRVVEGDAALFHLVLLDVLHLLDAVIDRAQALDLLHLVALRTQRQRVANDLVLPFADAR